MLMKFTRLRVVLGGVMLFILMFYPAAHLSAVRYGEGSYGVCNYGQGCNISITTSGTVALSATPTVSGVYTIAEDVVEVTTNSPDGYTLTLETDSATENSLDGSDGSISAVSGTPASPVTLSMNEWGFRVDGLSGFGAGPTSPVTNQASSSVTFAALPFMNSAATIKTTAGPALSGDTTDVWYGVRVDTSLPAGTYTRTVTYTATAL